MLHNGVDMPDVLQQLAQEGYTIAAQMVARLSLYLTQHIKRFGDYVLDMDAKPEPSQPDKVFLSV